MEQNSGPSNSLTQKEGAGRINTSFLSPLVGARLEFMREYYPSNTIHCYISDRPKGPVWQGSILLTVTPKQNSLSLREFGKGRVVTVLSQIFNTFQYSKYCFLKYILKA